MANAESRSASAALDVEGAVIKIDAVIAAMSSIAESCGSPTDYILWMLSYALRDSVSALKGEVQS